MIGKQILHYKIIKQLGQGGMGVVYLAEDNKLKRQAATKFLPGHIATDSEIKYRFAHFYSMLGEPKNALKSLRRSTEGGFFCYPYISIDPILESIRGASEYKGILEDVKSHYEAYKKKYGTIQL
jgi:serine/threonine protein kinase